MDVSKSASPHVWLGFSSALLKVEAKVALVLPFGHVAGHIRCNPQQQVAVA
jgi:hypothetical protein